MSPRSLSLLPLSARAMSWVGRLASLGMLALLAWLAAHIYWRLTVAEPPPSLLAAETDPRRAAARISSQHLFGVATDTPAGVSTVATPMVTPALNIQLNGAIAAQRPGDRAYAVLVIEGEPAQVVREGDEVAPGITLQRVLTREVELLRGGRVQILHLPER